jgi:hypothetical protein
MPELRFLVEAGVGFPWHENISPSWVPRFDALSNDHIYLIYSSNFAANRGIFDQNQGLICAEVSGSRLAIRGTIWDRVVSVSSTYRKESTRTRSGTIQQLFEFICDFLAQNAQYDSVMSRLQAVIYAFLHKTQPFDKASVSHTVEFIALLITWQGSEDENYVALCRALGIGEGGPLAERLLELAFRINNREFAKNVSTKFNVYLRTR